MLKAGISILILLLSGSAFAETVVFVHGRTGTNNCGTDTTDRNNYWGDAKNITGGERKVFVGYDGASDPRQWGECRAQSNLWTVLYKECRGEKSCKVVCHSAGCYAVDYFLSNFGWAVDNYDINISYITAMASATGGSELANLAFWESNSMVSALKTGTARGFNHNVTSGIPSYHAAGYDGWWYTAAILPGEDDGSVSFHSACGKNSTKMSVARTWWNWSGTSSDWDECKNDGVNWNNHYVLRADVAGYNSSKQAYSGDHFAVGQKSLGQKIIDHFVNQ